MNILAMAKSLTEPMLKLGNFNVLMRMNVWNPYFPEKRHGVRVSLGSLTNTLVLSSLAMIARCRSALKRKVSTFPDRLLNPPPTKKHFQQTLFKSQF